MVQDISQAAGSGVEIEIAGKKWKLAPLTVGDLSALQEDIRNRRLTAARKACGDMPTAQLVDILTDIVRMSIDGETMDREMETLAGCQFAIWRSLRKADTKLTLEQVGEMFTVDSLFHAVLPVLQKLSGMGEEPASPQPQPQETP